MPEIFVKIMTKKILSITKFESLLMGLQTPPGERSGRPQRFRPITTFNKGKLLSSAGPRSAWLMGRNQLNG